MIEYGNDYPDPMAEDGAQLLDDVHEFLRAYVAFPSEVASIAVTLWAAHTHLVGAFESTPRLTLLSPEKQCGKTRVLELLDLLSASAERLSDASPAYMFRRIGAGEITVLLDEADAIWRRGKADESAEALRSIVNAGHRKGAFVGRVQMTGQTAKLVRHAVYAPTALAGIGDCLPDTVLDRAVIVQMRRRAPGEQVAEYRERTTRPEGELLRVRLAAWAAEVIDRVGEPWPDMPAGVADRPADVWEPLLMIGDLAGGEWPKYARVACQAFVDGAATDMASTGVKLLEDLRELFGASEVMTTNLILNELQKLDESPWAEYSFGKPVTARELAKLLRPFEVRPGVIRIGSETFRGYRRADLEDAWTRYLPTPSGSVTSETSVTQQVSVTSDVTDVSLVTGSGG